MSGRARPWHKTRKFLDGLTGDLPDEELTAMKRYMERRSREAAQVTVTPVSTAQHCLPRSLNPEIPSDVHVSMKEMDEGRMNPEPTKLESSSAGTGFETPGQQYPPDEGVWETGRTIADGHLLIDIGSNQGGDISLSKERVRTRAGTAMTPENSPNAIFRKASRNPEDKTPSEENEQFNPGGKGEKPPPWNAAVMVLSFFLLGGTLGRGKPAACVMCFLSVCVFRPVHYLLFLSGDHCSAS